MLEEERGGGYFGEGEGEGAEKEGLYAEEEEEGDVGCAGLTYKK